MAGVSVGGGWEDDGMASQEALGAQFQARQKVSSWHPVDPDAAKSAARGAIASARDARLAGDPSNAEYHRRDAAVQRGHAQDALGIQAGGLQSRWTYGDTRPTRRLP